MFRQVILDSIFYVPLQAEQEASEAKYSNKSGIRLMPRIAGVNISDDKRVEIGLSYIFGLGLSKSQELLQKLNISGNPKFSELTETQIDLIRNYIEKDLTVEGDLKQIIQQNIRRLKEISSYRGHRHSRNLPVRGQRTKTNARTKRGKKVTVGSGRKKSAEKT